MPLLTTELRAQLPKLFEQENTPDPTVYAKFFTPDSCWTWYVTEGEDADGDFLFFAFVVGLALKQWRHFKLSELEGVRGDLGLPIERDLHFTPQVFSLVREAERI